MFLSLNKARVHFKMCNFPHVSLFMQNVTNLYLFSKVPEMNALPENLTETKMIRNGLLQTWNDLTCMEGKSHLHVKLVVFQEDANTIAFIAF